MKLNIIIKKKYFDEILKGEKTEEYRLITSYWKKRLIERNYEYVLFKNGYNINSDFFKIQYLGYEVRTIIHEFFGENQINVFAIKLGEIIK